MNNLIQWPMAKYWTKQCNPVIGCKPCSPACEHCYAAAWARRFGQSFKPHKSSKRTPPRKGIIFCGNVTDLFGDWRTTEDMGNDIIHAAFRGWDADATYLWLTKRVGNMCNALELANKTIREHWFHNHYFGFTAENQEWFERRCRHMCEFPVWANAPWLSLEPLLGPVELRGVNASWVVVGCESGRNRRPCEIKWIEDVLSACMPAGIPVFVKQIRLPDGRFTNKIEEFPEHLRVRQVPWEKKGNEDDDD